MINVGAMHFLKTDNATDLFLHADVSRYKNRQAPQLHK